MKKKSTNRKPINKKNTNKKTINEKSADKKPINKKNTDKKPINEKNTDKKPINEKNINKNIDVFKMILAVIMPLVGLFIQLPRYIVNSHEWLRIILLLLMGLGVLFVIICSFQQITRRKRIPYSKCISSLIKLWSIVSVGFILIVIILWLLNKPELRIQEDYDTEAFIKMTNEDVYPRISMNSFDYDNDTYFSIDLYNYSDNIIVFKDKDAVEIELLEFTPFEELEIDFISNGEGEIGFLEEPIELVAEITPVKKTYPALFIENNIKRKPNGAMLKIAEDDTKTLKIHIHPQQEGLYRFRIKLNYSMKGKPESKYTKEFTLFCDEGELELGSVGVGK